MLPVLPTIYILFASLRGNDNNAKCKIIYILSKEECKNKIL